jgi:hypothetical protein
MNSTMRDHAQADLARSSDSQASSCSRQQPGDTSTGRWGALASHPVRPTAGMEGASSGAHVREKPYQLIDQPSAVA